MHGIALAMTLMLPPTAGAALLAPPPVERPRLVMPAITAELAAEAVPPRTATRVARRGSTLEKIFATAGGAAVGWLAGSAIGFVATKKSDHADDVSGLRGVVIGAPIGAIIGGFVGYQLAK